VGLAIFVAITVSMVFGWGGAPMPALPDTWVTGKFMNLLPKILNLRPSTLNL
jgi:hypothetical protein